MQEMTATENQLDQVAEAILKAYPEERVFGFYGEMGAGKTTLIKAICRALGVHDVTSSPHFDFYRIDEPADASRVGFEEYLYSGHYCFIEWTEKVEEILQGDFIPITIERVDDDRRRFLFDFTF